MATLFFHADKWLLSLSLSLYLSISLSTCEIHSDYAVRGRDHRTICGIQATLLWRFLLGCTTRANCTLHLQTQVGKAQWKEVLLHESVCGASTCSCAIRASTFDTMTLCESEGRLMKTRTRSASQDPYSARRKPAMFESSSCRSVAAWCSEQQSRKVDRHQTAWVHDDLCLLPGRVI